jgi:hypothetical protein
MLWCPKNKKEKEKLAWKAKVQRLSLTVAWLPFLQVRRHCWNKNPSHNKMSNDFTQ